MSRPPLSPSVTSLNYRPPCITGVEHEFPQRYLPDGRLTVHGFLCLFDVSSVAERSFDFQLEATQHILQSLQKTKKPVVLVTTKNDKVCVCVCV